MKNKQLNVRSDIQGLRALAVIIVIIFHVYPLSLTGGYIGVDVFFVISGFLITSHLIKEISDTGTLVLSKFWARRIRRLLPAASVVLLAAIFLSINVLPENTENQNLREIIASSIYLENWELSAKSVDYLAVDNDPSSVQHFWSLSIEEQFYFIWPLLMISVIYLSRHLKKQNQLNNNDHCSYQIKLILNLLISIFIISFSYSTYLADAGGQGYFSTFTRAWEFSAGGILVFICKSIRFDSRKLNYSIARLAISWSGFTVILACAFFFDSDTRFPGYIAILPVIATCAIIFAKTDSIQWSVGKLSALKPIMFIGNISYSAYLWHWLLVVSAPFLFAKYASPEMTGVLVILITLALSWSSKIFIEDPFLKKDSIVRNPKFAYIIAFSSVATISLVSANNITNISPADYSNKNIAQYQSLEELHAKLKETLEKQSWEKADQLPGQHAYAPEWIIDHCSDINIQNEETMNRCVYGNPDGNKTVVLLGDSWVSHFVPAIRQALPDNWRIQIMSLSQCPIADVIVHKWNSKEIFTKCNHHRKEVFDWLEKNKPDLIIESDSPVSTISRLMFTTSKQQAINEFKKGLITSYKKLSETGIQTIHLESPPTRNCFSEKTDSPYDCKSNQGTLVQRRLSKLKLQVAKHFGFNTIDTTYWVCTKNLICPNQIGGTLIKADPGHFTGKFSQMLGKVLNQSIFNSEKTE